MSSDPPIPNHHDEEKISRRELGRYAALSAVAAAISGKAAAQHQAVTVGPFPKASSTMNGTPGCQLFLDLLPSSTTVNDLLYGKFYVVLKGLAANARRNPSDPSTYRPELADGLDRFADFLEGVDDGNTPAWQFYTNDANRPPGPKWPALKWKDAHGDKSGAAQKKIVDHFRFPFLNLGPNVLGTNVTKGRREIISEYIHMKDPWDPTQAMVPFRIGTIRYCDIFKKPRNHPDVCGPMCKAPDKYDPAWTKFRLIRQAFHHGIFADMSTMSETHAMDKNVMIPQPNGLCFSESAQECVPMHNGFCWEVAGSPGAGSTFCE